MADDSLPGREARRPRGPRVSQACTRCRTGKIRCDGKMPACSPCVEKGEPCVYPAIQKVRGPGKSKQRMGELEERLAVLESMLRQQLTKDLSDDTASRSPRPLPGASGSSSPSAQRETPPGGGLMLPFHQVSERFALWKQENCTKALDRISLSPLTASTLELRLAEDCLDKVCAELPFLRIPWFLEQTRRPDALSVPDAWWQGIINALIASTFSFQTVNSSFRELAVYSWAFFRNAYAVLPELIINGDSLGAAQAVMAMVVFMRQSADTRTTALLLSIAIRLQHSAGRHVGGTSESISSPAEDENRSRLYWAAFILDMDMAVSTGLPPVHGGQTVTMDLPGGNWLQGEGASRWEGVVFKLRAELAGIQGRIATQLMAQLITPQNADLVAVESELEAWVIHVPFDIMPSWHGQPDKASRAKDVSVAMLHLVYYNSQSMICWASVRHVTAEMLESPQATVDSIHERTKRHKRIARAAARAAITSLSQFPTQPFAQLWRALCHAVSASIALLALVCKDPTHPEAQGDLPLLVWFVSFLDKLVRDEGCDLEKMRDGISKIERVATHAVTAGLGSAMPVNPALWPLSMASGRTGKAIGMLLTCESYHPMYLAQSFTGNTPNRDTQNAKHLAEILGLSWGKNGYGPFVPDSLMPATYGFAFGSGNPG